MILGYHLFFFFAATNLREPPVPLEDTFNELSHLILHGCHDVWLASIWNPLGPVETSKGCEKLSPPVDYRFVFCDSQLSDYHRPDLALEVLSLLMVIFDDLLTHLILRVITC